MNLASNRAVRGLVPITVAAPMLSSALGIDGGAMFQIVASENLGLSASAIGVAFGCGVLSVPLQLWAARLPLWRARRNLQRYCVGAAAQALVLAMLVGSGATGSVAAIALAITVTAEISLSVQYATSFQPLLSATMSTVERQALNTRGRAIGGVLLAIALLGFTGLGRAGRAGFLVLIAGVAIGAALRLRLVPSLERPSPVAAERPSRRTRPSLPTPLKRIFTVLVVLNLGALPLLLVYVDDVLWPGANLGVVGALQVAGTLVAAFAWRPTVDGVLRRARSAGAALCAAALAIAALRAPVDSHVEQAVLLAAVVVAAASVTFIRIAMLELAHRSIDHASSVRAFTILDVVASSSLQIGLLASGLLIAASGHASGWFVDPYRLYIVVFVAAAALAIMRVGGRERHAGPFRRPS